MCSLMLTSGYDFEGYNIVEYLGFCSGECVLGTGFLSNLEADISDILGIGSTFYKEKLAKAKGFAAQNLEQQALSRGANAVIGVDLDYTMFSSNMIGVMMNGTAVKIERVEASYGGKLFQIYVDTYNQNLPFRFLKVEIREDKKMRVFFTPFKKYKISALHLDISFKTIFGDIVTISNVPFIDIDTTDQICMTEYYKANFPDEVFGQFRSASIHVRRYVMSEKVYSSNVPDQIIAMSESHLQGLRALYGQDVVGVFSSNDHVWTCLCGKENNLAVSKCTMCGRENDSQKMQEKGNTYEFLMNVFMQKNSAREIYEYLTVYNEEHDHIFPEAILNLVKESVSLERLYGNQKESCIKKIKEYAKR